MMLWIALVAMLLDHLNWLFVHEPAFWLVGRIAAPVFAFYAGAGWYWTRDRHRRIRQFLILGLVSQLFYAFTFPWGFQQLNILFTLAGFGLLVLPAQPARRVLYFGLSLLIALVAEYGLPAYIAAASGFAAAFAADLREPSRVRLISAVFAVGAAFLASLFLQGVGLWSFVWLILAICIASLWGARWLLAGRYALGREFFWRFYPAHLFILCAAVHVAS